MRRIWILSFLCLLIPGYGSAAKSPAASAKSTPVTPVLASKQNATNFINQLTQDVWVNYDSTKVDKYYSDSFMGHEENTDFNREQLKKYVYQYAQLHPAPKYKIDDLILSGNKIVVRWTLDTRDPRTLEPMQAHALAIYQIKNNKVASLWLAVEPGLD